MGRDDGSALVVALAVAVIGIGLATVVASQAIIVMHDASRDRVRTVEIHSAESALDGTFKVLETGTPCQTTIAVGTGSQAVNVAVDIAYYSSTAELTCTAGTLSGKPVKAVVTSSAVPTSGNINNAGTQRQIQATVNLVPLTQPSAGAALFAGGSLGASNSGIIEPIDPAHPVQVWIENSNWNCANTYKIDGDLIVPDGSINMSNSCLITGNAWAKSGFQASNTVRISKNLVVYNGSLGASNNVYFGGNVSVGGAISDTWSWTHGITVKGTVCSTNVGSPCGTLPIYTHRGLPEVDYKPTDWSGYNTKTMTDFGSDVVSQLTFTNSWAKPQYLSHPCSMDNTLPDPVIFPSGNATYDLRTCSFSSSNTRTFVLNGDVAIFAKSFTTSNQFLIKSGDGKPHSIWFIVPDGGTANNKIEECSSRGSYTPGNVQFSNQTTIQSPIQIFVYSPCDVTISNDTALIGQIYGRNIQTSNNFHLIYSGMGIPGVDLGGVTTTATGGYAVQIVNKHEIQN
jgi:hypothetical protein